MSARWKPRKREAVWEPSRSWMSSWNERTNSRFTPISTAQRRLRQVWTLCRAGDLLQKLQGVEPLPALAAVCDLGGVGVRGGAARRPPEHLGHAREQDSCLPPHGAFVHHDAGGLLGADHLAHPAPHAAFAHHRRHALGRRLSSTNGSRARAVSPIGHCHDAQIARVADRTGVPARGSGSSGRSSRSGAAPGIPDPRATPWNPLPCRARHVSGWASRARPMRTSSLVLMS